jgi:hypothetical protein
LHNICSHPSLRNYWVRLFCWTWPRTFDIQHWNIADFKIQGIETIWRKNCLRTLRRCNCMLVSMMYGFLRVGGLTRSDAGHTPDSATNSRAVPIYATTVNFSNVITYQLRPGANSNSPSHSMTLPTARGSSASKSSATSTAVSETRRSPSSNSALQRSRVE